MTRHTPTRRYLDLVVDGGLAALVKRERALGRSWQGIAFLIHDQYEVDITRETLRAWFLEETLEEEESDGDQGEAA
jgi:hypothetical protein